jgi:hypothetical protein
MHHKADHRHVDQGADRQSAVEDHLAEPDGRSAGEGMSNDHRTVRRISKKPAAKLVSSPPNLPAAKDRTAKIATSKRYALANQLPKRKPKAFCIAVRSGG